jgi:hypothetical protein
MNYKQLIAGTLSFLPGLSSRFTRTTGGTVSPRYCYSVWLRHMVMGQKACPTARLGIVAELGPGDSLGIGLAALLSGAKKYIALDLVPFGNAERNLAVFDEIVALFKSRQAIPDDKEFPNIRPLLPSYGYPSYLLGNCDLGSERIERIRRSIILAESGQPDLIRYIAPWNDTSCIEPASVDWLFSQAVMEHIDDLPEAYTHMSKWLKPDGLMTHQVDFGSHGLTEKWNGHWGVSAPIWSLLRGRRPYLINRVPYSTHLSILSGLGFDMANTVTERNKNGISHGELARPFLDLSETDLATRGAFFATQRP